MSAALQSTPGSGSPAAAGPTGAAAAGNTGASPGQAAAPPAGTPGGTSPGQTSSSGAPGGAGLSGTPGGASGGGSLLEQGFQPGGSTDPAQAPGEKTPEGQTQQNAGAGAPEKYEDFKLPEGVKADSATMDQFRALAKSLNLNQENAQKLVDLQTQAAQAQVASMQAQFRQATDGWKQETLQALGSEYQRELGIAARAIDRFGTPSLRQLLNDSGLGNHKDVVSFFVKVGKALSEDPFADGRQSTNADKPIEDVLYPNQGRK